MLLFRYLSVTLSLLANLTLTARSGEGRVPNTKHLIVATFSFFNFGMYHFVVYNYLLVGFYRVPFLWSSSPVNGIQVTLGSYHRG